jgi:hypothetical protein
MIAPERPYQAEPSAAPDVLLALRELFSAHPNLIDSGCEELRNHLGFYLQARPEVWEVEAAMEVLRVEGRVLS